MILEGTVQEGDSTLCSRHHKRSHSAKVTSSTLSTGNIKVLFLSILRKEGWPKIGQVKSEHWLCMVSNFLQSLKNEGVY